MLKLNLGSGKRKIEGFIGIDKYDEDADVKADCLDLPYEDDSVDEILAIHLLEHLSKEEGEKALEHWYKKLKIGGKLYMELPNIDRIIEMYKIEGDLYKKLVNNWELIHHIYGSQSNEGQFHKWGYTYKHLKNLLEEKGFKKIERIKTMNLKCIGYTHMGVICIK